MILPSKQKKILTLKQIKLMKNLKILFAFFAFAAFFASCGPEEELLAPEITFNPSTNPVVASFTDGVYNVDVHVTVVAEAKIKTTVIERYDDGDLNTTVSETLTAAVSGDRNETDFTFTMTDALNEADFSNNVRYKIIITDQQDQVTSQNYTVQKSATTYTHTFTVKSGATVIEGATVTIEGVENTTNNNGVAAFELSEGTFSYTVTKTGYNTATGNITVTGNGSTDVDLTPATTALSEYSAEIQMIMGGTQGQAYGLNYTTNGDGTAIHIDAFGNAQFVELANDSYTTVEDLQAAYDAGTKITTILQPFDYNSKAFSAKYFISNYNGTLYLIKTTAGKVITSAQNYVKFVEKH